MKNSIDIIMLLLILHAWLVSSNKCLPFGTFLGSNLEVKAFSNCHNNSLSIDLNYHADIVTGLKYQSVEYARRWLIQVKNLAFKSIPCASDIYHLNSFYDISSGESIPLYRIPNGSFCKPNEGSLLIYKRTKKNPIGHVAIITYVGNDHISVSEQDWGNQMWSGDYSRNITMNSVDSKYYVVDNNNKILGWMSIKNKGLCVDNKCQTCPKEYKGEESACLYE